MSPEVYEDDDHDNEPIEARPRTPQDRLRLLNYRMDKAEKRLETLEAELRRVEDRVHPLETVAPSTESRIARVERFILGLLMLIASGVLGALLALINIPKP